MPWGITAAIIVVLLIAAALLARGRGSSGGPVSAQYHRVAPMDLEVKFIKDGELQAVNNLEIASEVEGQTVVQTIVKEGATVKRGDVLVTLDSASIRQKIEDTTIEIQKADADLTNARELKDIQESKNAADFEAAEVSLALAELDLRDYEEAAYPQQLANTRTDLEMAEIDLKNRREDLGQTRNLFAKGFVTAADVKKAELEVTKAENAVSKAQTALRRLMDYTHASDLAAKRNALSQAEQKLQRVKRENAAQMSQRNADVNAKQTNLAIINRRMDRLQEQLDACTINAPTDGMVVYATSNDRNAQNPIQEGATVRERQAILRLPDTTSMKAVVRAQEAQVPRLREGQRALVRVVGIAEPIPATLSKISILADSGGRWWNPDTKEFPVDLVLDRTIDGLKPGMGAMVEVLISRAEQVLAVPLGTIYSVGNRTFVFARQGNEHKPIEIKVGMTSETHAQIASGLTGGEDVLLLERGQGQQLLERAGIKIEPATRPSGSFDRPGALNGERQGERGGDRGAPGGANGDRPRRNRGEGTGGPQGPGSDPQNRGDTNGGASNGSASGTETKATGEASRDPAATGDRTERPRRPRPEPTNGEAPSPAGK
ncbi:MAG TPA: HlyD family efflux transporter periplasmic adaptor subunit [Tepidisphaeraceae bacterium]|nr:HlyD family efflux transporter periplasmic adaptor subunit [Tepidisphaeraceae bacterium]